MRKKMATSWTETNPTDVSVYDAAIKRLGAWSSRRNYTYKEHMQHQADLLMMPVDDGTEGPVWRKDAVTA